MAKQSPFIQMEEYLQTNFNFVHNVVLNKVASVNVMTDELEYLDDYAFNTLWGEVLRIDMRLSKTILMGYLRSSSSKQFDPFKTYFSELPTWQPDDQDYIQLLADTISVPAGQREHWEKYLRRWLIATVGCAIDPLVTNQQVLTLVGAQGIGKTKWTERLVPEQLLTYYYSGNVNPDDKDSKINLGECFLINLDELGNLNKGDLNTLKQLITMSSVRVRRPYAAMPENMPRRASFIGSVNNQEFLRDDTGNRRYLCVDTIAIDYNHAIDINKVYAQAYYLFLNGEKHWFDGQEIETINQLNKLYKVQHVELEFVNEFFEPCGRDEEAEEMTTTQILEYLRRHGSAINNASVNALGRALSVSDYLQVRRNGGIRYYRLKKKPARKK